MAVARRVASAVALGVLLAGLLLASAEALQRAREQGAWRLEPELGYVPRLAPHEGRGWDEEAVPSPRGQRRRVVFVGDSVTYGLGVAAADAWPAVVGRLLGQGRVEAFDFGVVGWDGEQVATLVETRIEAWAPEALVWGTYANDLFRTAILSSARTGDPIYVRRTVPEAARLLGDPLGAWLLAHSALYRRAQAAAYLRWRDTPGPQVDGGPEWYGAQVDRVVAWARSHHVPLLVVAIPPEAIAGDCTGAWICDAGRSWYAQITGELARRDIAWVDGLGAWAGRGPFPLEDAADVDHPNALGHRLLAEAVAPRVAEMLGLSSGSALQRATRKNPLRL